MPTVLNVRISGGLSGRMPGKDLHLGAGGPASRLALPFTHLEILRHSSDLSVFPSVKMGCKNLFYFF